MATESPIDGVIGFLGAGRMAQALAGGFVEAGLAEPRQIAAYDPNEAATSAFLAAAGSGAQAAKDPAALMTSSRIVFAAVKPGVIDAALRPAAGAWRSDEQLLVSVAAGVRLRTLERALPAGAAVVRVMPNTPCLVREGASCFALGEHATSEHGAEVQRLLGAVGFAAEVSEKLLDAVTGLSGSGPAFVYAVIEALADGGVRSGLPRDLAAELAARTVAGAARMVTETGEHPAALRDAVASPGGTTIAGIAELERNGLRWSLIEAVTAATRRSTELGGHSDDANSAAE